MLRVAVVVCLVGLAVATPVVVRTKEEIQAFRSYLENTRDSDSNGSKYQARLQANPLANPEENSGKFDGDIVLDDFEIERMVMDYAMGRNAYTFPGTKWPNDTVVWEFGEGEFGPLQQEAIWEGIRDIERHTCVKFRQREPSDTNFVRLTGGAGGCYAHVGYWSTRGIHTLNLARNTPGVGCFRHATIVHEWMHILGFLHMQSTWDRDNYVRIVEENLRPGTEHNFAIYTNDLVDNLGVEYDYVSCLHYGPYAFSDNGEKTIVALQEHEGTMGQREYITEKDWIRINRHYGCPGAWDECPLQQEAIWEGIRDIERHTCVKFRQREPSDTNFVRLTGGAGGCYAHVGYWSTRGIHTLNLARNTPGVGCFRHATIVHEWMHILGFLHMQSTWDRDNYVRIVEENLRPGTEHNFAIYTNDLVDNLGVEYDYVSCLHYGPYAFSDNGEKTIVALQEHEGTMGQREYITEKDWIRINRHYGCPGAWDE